MTYDYDELFPGRFLKSGEFKGKDVTLMISGIRLEELPGEKGPRVRGIIAFNGTTKELVLNKTNGECLKALFGRDTGKWLGKRVTFYPAPYTDSFTGEVGTAIRVRGSPEIEADLRVEIRMPKKKPMTMVMRATGKKAAAPAAKGAAPKPATPAAPAAEPAPVTNDGEPPDDVLLPGQEQSLPFDS